MEVDKKRKIYRLYLNLEVDTDIEDFLEKIPRHLRNECVKTALREYIKAKTGYINPQNKTEDDIFG